MSCDFWQFPVQGLVEITGNPPMALNSRLEFCNDPYMYVQKMTQQQYSNTAEF